MGLDDGQPARPVRFLGVGPEEVAVGGIVFDGRVGASRAIGLGVDGLRLRLFGRRSPFRGCN